MQSTKVLIILIILSIFMLNCTESPTPPAFKDEVIVNAYLIVGSGVDTVYVSKTLSVGQRYSYGAAALSSLPVFISVDNKTYQLSEYRNKPGAYYLPKDSLMITPGKTYNLEIHAGDKIVRASTLAPGKIKMTDINVDTTYFPFPNPALSTPIRISWSETPYADAYQVVVKANTHKQLVDYGFEQFVKTHLEQFDNDTLKAFPAVNDFPVSIYETTAELFWISFYYYGDYTIKIYAIDQNLWDFITSPTAYILQSSEYEQPNMNIEGGYGIFAAVSVDSAHVHIKSQFK